MLTSTQAFTAQSGLFYDGSESADAGDLFSPSFFMPLSLLDGRFLPVFPPALPGPPPRSIFREDWGLTI